MTQTIEELQAEDRVLEVAKLFPRQGEWTERDYFSLPETNSIVELSKGRLTIITSQTFTHQKILGRITIILGEYIRSNNLGEILYAPMNVKLGKDLIRQPDMIFMSNEHQDRIMEELWGVPDLVVEILSKGTIKTDRKDKYQEYQKAGVSEYWIVDPFQQTVEVFTFATECLAKKLENGAYVLFGKWGIGEIAHSKLLTGFQVAVNSVFE